MNMLGSPPRSGAGPSQSAEERKALLKAFFDADIKAAAAAAAAAAAVAGAAAISASVHVYLVTSGLKRSCAGPSRSAQAREVNRREFFDAPQQQQAEELRSLLRCSSGKASYGAAAAKHWKRRAAKRRSVATRGRPFEL